MADVRWLWWACFGVLAFFGLGEVVMIAVVWPLTGHAPAHGTFTGLVCLPLSIVALRRARAVDDERR